MARFISRKEAAKEMGVTPQTISNYIEKGKLNGLFYKGRVLVDSATLNAILDNNKQINILNEEVRNVEEKTNEATKKLIKYQNEVFSALKVLDSIDNDKVLTEFVLFMLNRFSYNENNITKDYNILYKLFKGKNIIEIGEEEGIGITYISKLIYDIFDSSILSWRDNDNILMKSINDAGLSVHTKNVLIKNGFENHLDLLKVKDFKLMKGLGKKSIMEIENLKKKISLKGACLSDSVGIGNQADGEIYKNEHSRFYMNYVWKQCKTITKENEDKLKEYDVLHENNQVITYIVSDSFKCYKIGKTIDMRRRLLDLYVANPTIKIEGFLYEDCENQLHRICRIRNIAGEWFLLTEVEVKLILNHRFDLLQKSIEDFH